MAQTIDATVWLTFSLTVIPAVYALLRPLIKARIAAQKDERLKRDLEIADNFAQTIVAELSAMSGMTNADRREAAVQFLINEMANLGKAISKENATAKVEAAYQNYKRQINNNR
ncbi:phage holin, LLH family [Levilactobacillus lindianensis]|uniref:phage holin, LLH family n=1 Tax=Levilactobacillus lindianensis TaxID=2486018 RepID=UPI0013DE0C59|nr:phage holin, LLH family [Levilactobacillus lindianensis]